MKNEPFHFPSFRMITVSGRIASGSTTLGHKLAKILGWHHVEGGEVFWEAVRTKMGLEEKDTDLRPDKEDTDFDSSLKEILTKGKNLILETNWPDLTPREFPAFSKSQ